MSADISQQLPPRDQNLFRKIARCYEQKQYKKGLAFSKEILKSNPDHGETLAMRGLILYCMGKKDEAFTSITSGLKKNLKSYVCWHVYGFYHRSQRNFDDAIKAYRNALKWEKDNLTVLRDLSVLQIHMRDLEGYKETRYQLLMLKPGQRASWIAYAMAYHLLQDYQMTLNILEEFFKIQPEVTADVETSEFLLYQNFVMRDAQMYSAALTHLRKYESMISDKLAVEEIKGDLCIRLKQNNEAVACYEKLINRNPENRQYYMKLQEAHCIDSKEKWLELLQDLIDRHPKAVVPKRLLLEFSDGDLFTKTLDKFLQFYIRKGSPALFKWLRFLYGDIERVQQLEELLYSYDKSLAESGKLSINDDSDEAEPPTTQLWLDFIFSQHFDQIGNTEKALFYVDRAIRTTPTLVELYVLRARILKHADNILAAVRWIDEAQSLDTADRFINSKCAKYMLRANMMTKALYIAEKFTRESVPGLEYLKEMQCMWYEIECARSYFSMGKYGEALKKCHEVAAHFNEFIDDQFDFHSYCLRKMTLCAYYEMLQFQDRIKGHKFYQKAAHIAIKIYLLLDEKPMTDSAENLSLNSESLSTSEMRKLRNKKRKQEMREKQEKERISQLEQKRRELNRHKFRDSDSEHPENFKNEAELSAEQLQKVHDPLMEATKFLEPLLYFAPDVMETHILGFEVYFRRNKFFLMLRCILRMRNMDPNHPMFHNALIRFMLKYITADLKFEEPIKEVLEEAFKDLCQGKSCAEINKEFIANNIKSFPHLIEGAKVMYLLDATKSSQAQQLVLSCSDDLKDKSIKACQNAFESLCKGEFGPCPPDSIESFKVACHRIHPYSLSFAPSSANEKFANGVSTDFVCTENCCEEFEKLGLCKLK